MATNSKASTAVQRLEDDTERQLEMQLLNSEQAADNVVTKKKKMPAKKKKATTEMVAGGGDSSMFGVTLKQLKSLMTHRSKELIERLNSAEYNGIKGLLEKLKVDSSKGLESTNEQDFEQRRNAYGRNEIPQKPLKTFLAFCFQAIQDPILMLLLGCSILSIILSLYKPPKKEGEVHEEHDLEWIEGVAILTAVLVVVLVTAFNDWRKERQFRGLQSKIEKDNLISVFRDGFIQQVPVVDLVVGDICFIKYGDILPADGLLIQSSDVKIDESSLTGETDLIKKNEADDIGLMSGTQVMEGSGRMLIVGVGLNSQVGTIMSLLGATDCSKKTKQKKKKGKKDDNAAAASDDKKLASTNQNDGQEEEMSDKKNTSVLQPKLARIVLYAGYLGIIGALLTLIFLITRYSITNFWINGNRISREDASYFVSFIIQAISVIVVCVPEGLPLAVTLALTYAIQRMMTDHNFVRHLYACETMANATTICSDKTGTLTTNRMTVVQSYMNEKHNKDLPAKNQLKESYLSLLFEAITVNCNSTSKIEQPQEGDGGLPKQIGNKTECALLDFVLRLGGSYEAVRENFPQSKVPKVYTFNSARKMMSTVVQRDDGYRVYTKGASEMVLKKCTKILGENAEEKAITEDDKENITKTVIEKMAGEALRTICIAYKNLGKDDRDWDNEDDIIGDLTCIAIVGIEDPVRKEVPDAILKCQRAGVVVRMVTGDNVMTARSIATKCGILKPDDDFLVLESKEFNARIRDENGKVSQNRLDEVWPKLRVLARSSPQDKYILVNGIVESNITTDREVVAVTGDGTNDAPALKRADVGFAMGIQGTEVAKQASDIILTDDNFSSIVKAIIWGRNVYDCIAKFIQFQLTANLTALVISVVSAAAISIVPLKAVQMLWVNLVMDTLASLALATEPPTDELLNRKPYGRTKSIISGVMLRNIVGQSLYQLVVMFTILYAGQYFLDVESTVQKIQSDPHQARELSSQFTIVFNAFVLMTLFNEINSRKLHGQRNIFKGIFNNPFFCCIWLFCFISQILIISFGGRVFSCVPLSWYQWLWSLGFGVGSLIWQQIILTIPINCGKGSPSKNASGRATNEPGSDGEGKVQRQNTNEVRFSTISQLAGATVVAEPPPAFTRYMLRKSVDRLNTDFRVINEFRSRLEEIQDKCEEVNEIKRTSRADILDV